MLRKYYEYGLILLLSSVLTGLLYLYVNNISATEKNKSQLQISLENSSNRWNDLFYSDRSYKNPSKDVVVLAIDEPSLIEIGRWPWSRSVIDQITRKLLEYKVKTISYDIIFSEKESNEADSKFVKTITGGADQLILGTFSDRKGFVQPYQDYCLTQAFLFTGGGNLVKINPFFAVVDEANPYEEYPFNKLFVPVFESINVNSEKIYLANYEIQNKSKLTQYQLNTLEYFKKQRVYDYCDKWLTPEDDFDYNVNHELKNIYMSLFKATDDESLKTEIEKFKKSNAYIPIPQYLMWRQNIDSLQSNAKYTGSFVAHPDYDGIIRNYPLVLRTGNQLGTSYIPALGLQAYLAATGYQVQFKLENKGGEKTVGSADIYDVSGDQDKLISHLPVDREGKMLINYYGKQNTISYISAKELLNSSPKIDYSYRTDFKSEQFKVKTNTVDKAEFLKNKNIIFGATAVGIYDIRTTPNDIKYPGPEIHATVLSNLLDGDFLSFDRNEIKWAPIVFFIFVFVNLLVYIKTGARFGAVYFALTLSMLILLQVKKYSDGNIYYSAYLFVVLYSVAYFLTFIYKYFFQSRKSNEIKQVFSKYVSKDVVEEILKNEGAIELRGQKLHMSVFFSDIRGFTSFAENMDPVELSELLNKYFTPMSEIITRHQGTIDKYIGDAIMAMFGAPINYPDHAVKACQSALECIDELKKINQEFAARNWPKIDMGIGINTGQMNAGNIGSNTIQNYTVIGDSVNLASRLQTLNKTYNTNIIISEFTYDLVKDKFNCRAIDKVTVKGRNEPVTVYELLGLK
ncbi:MAG: CHASE2 domain-containing protein [Pseudobdellovibrio sp.]